jgi:pyocin large subunit-like protein
MVIKSNTVQAGWHIDNDDNSIDNTSTGSTFQINRNKNQSKNDQDLSTGNFRTKTTRNMSHTVEEGWTTTRPGKKKPKKKNNKRSAIESIITTIDGDIGKIDAGKHSRIYVTSSERKHKCNIPDDRKMEEELDFELHIM